MPEKPTLAVSLSFMSGTGEEDELIDELRRRLIGEGLASGVNLLVREHDGIARPHHGGRPRPTRSHAGRPVQRGSAARSHLGRASIAGRRRSRRTQARDSAEDREPRTTPPRRLATDSAQIDPKRDLTDRLSARRLSRYSLVLHAARMIRRCSRADRRSGHGS